jgi:pimeloyl-ACP methyl ester carboxylesterase
MTDLASVTTGRFWHDDAQIAYERWGRAGDPPLVLLHGILLDSGINRDLARRLVREGYEVVLLDFFGHGRSDRSSDPKDHRADFYAEQVLAVMDHLGFKKAVIGGVSLGCIVSLHVAHKAPERVQAMLLEMPVMEWSAPWAIVMLGPLLLSSRYLPLVHGPVARWLAKRPRPRNEVAATVLNTVSMAPAHMAAILHGILVGAIVPTESQRRALKMPALIIGHGGDRLHEFEDAWVLHQELEGSELIEARHILELRTRPDRLWPQIRDFLERVKPAQRRPRRAAG